MSGAIQPIGIAPRSGISDDRKIIAWEDRARRDALKHIALDLPNPKVYARYLPLRFVEAILGARQTLQGHTVALEYVDEMRPYGLVDYGSRCLTNFAMSVRRVLMEQDG